MSSPTRYYNLNGTITPREEAVVSVDDRGFRYGDGVFETMRVYDGTPFRESAHLDRLERSCDHIGLKHGVSRSELRQRIRDTLDANECAEAYIRLSITRGVQPGTITPDPSIDPTVVIYFRPLQRGGSAGQPIWDAPARLQTVPYRRIPADSIPSSMKSHNYLSGILGRLSMTDADEALFLDTEGNLSEGAASNLFFVVDDVLYTPSESCSILPGITRQTVMTLAIESDVPLETGRYAPDRLYSASEVFLTNSIQEIRPVLSVDDTEYDSGPITDLLRNSYANLVDRECYD